MQRNLHKRLEVLEQQRATAQRPTPTMQGRVEAILDLFERAEAGLVDQGRVDRIRVLLQRARERRALAESGAS